MQLIHEQALQALDYWRTIRLVLDITGVQAIDPVVAQELMSLSQLMKPLGAEVTLFATSSGTGNKPVRVLLDLHSVGSHHDLGMAFNLMIRRR